MGSLDLSPGAHLRAPTIPWPRRSRRFALTGEPLETRQLLSAAAFQPATAVSVGPTPAFAQTNVSPVGPLRSPGGPTGFSPTQIQTAYGVNQITFNTTSGPVVGNGAGQTIALIEEYYDPYILSNLNTFDSQYGLSASAVVHAIRPDRIAVRQYQLVHRDFAGRGMGARDRSRREHRGHGSRSWPQLQPTGIPPGCRGLRERIVRGLGGIDELGKQRVLGRNGGR